MVLREDLGVQYAKNMLHFGCGVAMYQPVSAADMRPPCVGYIDGNNRWNFVANVEWSGDDGKLQGNSNRAYADEGGYQPLDRKPMKMEELGIEWRPRTSIGVRQWTVDTSADTPNIGLPLGADAHIRYKSNSNFGAVLIAQKPITLTTYNDETLFRCWLRANSGRLSILHGHQLRHHGLWLVTRTYTTPRASINAWDSKDKEANMSVKAKANMMGELGGELDWTDKSTDKDWSHYSGQEQGATVVVFFDGIEVPAWKWWWESVKVIVGGGDGRQGSLTRTQLAERQASWDLEQRRLRGDANDGAGGNTDGVQASDYGLLAADLWGSETPLRRGSPYSGRSISRGRQSQSRKDDSSARNVSTPARMSKDLIHEPQNLPDHNATAIPDGNRTATSPPVQRFSMTSTVNPPTIKARNNGKTDLETSPPLSVPGNPLQRKTASPFLRNSS